MRLSYIVLISVTVIVTIISSIRTFQEKGAVSSHLRKMINYAALTEIANLLIAIPYYDNPYYVLLSHSLYYISIDWLLYYFLRFSLAYSVNDNIHKTTRVTLKGIWGLALLDTLSLQINIFTKHAFDYYIAPYSDGQDYVYITMKFPYHLHLTFSYIMVALIVFVLGYTLKNSVSFYKIKALAPLSILLALVVLNAAYLFFEFPLDWSVFLYSISGMLVHFFAISYVPKTLMSRSLQEAVDNLSEGLILFDINDKCLYVNDSAGKMFEITSDTLNATSFPVNQWITNPQLSTQSPFEKEFEFEKFGQKIYYKLQLNQLTSAKGKYLGCYFVINDITKEHNSMVALELAREEADKASSAKGAFLANMSHEIRTPINAVLGMNEMILRESNSPEIREYANNIQVSGDALLSLINDILDFSKIESGKMELQPVNYKPFQIIRACHTMISPRVSSKNLELKVSCDAECPTVLYGDEVRIRQIITNLLTNAVKYTETGFVFLTLKWNSISNDSGELIVKVKDTGMGISEENKDKLFHAFERIDEKKNRNIEGTGLGLSITNELIRLMGGTICVESKLGMGSEFTVKIPQSVVNSAPSGAYEQKNQEVSEAYEELFTAPKAKILAVDDYKTNLIVLKGLLKKTLVQLITATSGEEALNFLSSDKFDLVLMDHMMPGMDGVETYKRLKEMNNENSDVPVIMLTANAISGADKEYLEYGFCDYLSKPINGKTLEKTLLKHLPAELIEKRSE